MSVLGSRAYSGGQTHRHCLLSFLVASRRFPPCCFFSFCAGLTEVATAVLLMHSADPVPSAKGEGASCLLPPGSSALLFVISPPPYRRSLMELREALGGEQALCFISAGAVHGSTPMCFLRHFLFYWLEVFASFL
jgi:hypothetical protein